MFVFSLWLLGSRVDDLQDTHLGKIRILLKIQVPQLWQTQSNWSISGITWLHTITFINNKYSCYLIRTFFFWNFPVSWFEFCFYPALFFYYSLVILLISVVLLIIQSCKIRFILWVIIVLNLSVSQVLSHCWSWNLWEYCHNRAIYTLGGFLMAVQWLWLFKPGEELGARLNSVNVLQFPFHKAGLYFAILTDIY